MKFIVILFYLTLGLLFECDSYQITASQKCGCKCEDFIWYHDGKQYGNCFKANSTDEAFCFVNSESAKSCSDAQVAHSRFPTITDPEKLISYEACNLSTTKCKKETKTSKDSKVVIGVTGIEGDILETLELIDNQKLTDKIEKDENDSKNSSTTTTYNENEKTGLSAIIEALKQATLGISEDVNKSEKEVKLIFKQVINPLENNVVESELITNFDETQDGSARVKSDGRIFIGVKGIKDEIIEALVKNRNSNTGLEIVRSAKKDPTEAESESFADVIQVKDISEEVIDQEGSLGYPAFDRLRSPKDVGVASIYDDLVMGAKTYPFEDVESINQGSGKITPGAKRSNKLEVEPHMVEVEIAVKGLPGDIIKVITNAVAEEQNEPHLEGSDSFGVKGLVTDLERKIKAKQEKENGSLVQKVLSDMHKLGLAGIIHDLEAEADRTKIDDATNLNGKQSYEPIDSQKVGLDDMDDDVKIRNSHAKPTYEPENRGSSRTLSKHGSRVIIPLGSRRISVGRVKNIEPQHNIGQGRIPFGLQQPRPFTPQGYWTPGGYLVNPGGYLVNPGVAGINDNLVNVAREFQERVNHLPEFDSDGRVGFAAIIDDIAEISRSRGQGGIRVGLNGVSNDIINTVSGWNNYLWGRQPNVPYRYPRMYDYLY